MANFRIPLTANTAGVGTKLCYIHKPRALTTWAGTINAYGTFGGGTISYWLSTDGGTTATQQKDESGTLYSTTTADTVDIEYGGVPNQNFANQQWILYVVLTGSTTPTITIDIGDNT